MATKKITVLRMAITALVVLLAWPSLGGAQSWPRLRPIPHGYRETGDSHERRTPPPPTSPWQPLTNQPVALVNGACNPLLLTDGTVMVQDCGSQDWWQLTPDNTGSYVNGTWTQLASLASDYSPLYHSSAVLPDGRVIIEGGEYNFFNPADTNLGAIYDPLADTWTPVAPPEGWTRIGDAVSVVLPNGTYMQGNCCTKQAALLNPRTLTWTPTGWGKFDINNEEGWTLLPSGLVLAVDTYVPLPPFPYTPTGTNSEVYNPETGWWRSAGSTIVQLWDSAASCGGKTVASFELGPAILRPDGSVFYTGANSCGAAHTATYNSYSGRWTPGPDFPDGLDIADGPAALLPNGNVLLDTSPGIYNTPTYFFEWNGSRLNPVAGPPNAPEDSSFYGNMLVLPTGQILFTDFSNDIELYTSTGTYNEAWEPTIQSAPRTVRRGGSYLVSGTLFNGLSQGAAYGDDVQAATNYPLVRITNLATGHVFYSRTHDPTSMAVALWGGLVSTRFDVPANQERGPSSLVVVANGIPSDPVSVTVQ